MQSKLINYIKINFFYSRLIPIFVLAHFSHHLLPSLLVPLMPMIRKDLGLDYTQSGLLISAFSISYGISQLPAGWLADKISRQLMITISIVGVAVAGMFVGIFPWFTTMAVFLVLMGLMGGGYHPSAPPLISASVPPANLGRTLGLHVIGGSLSFFLAPLIGVFIARNLGWRGAYIGLAVPAVILGIFFYTRIKRLELPADNALKQPGEAEGDRKTSLSKWRLVVFLILSAFTSAIMMSTISFIPLFLVDKFNASGTAAAAMLSIVYSAGFWAAPLGGYISDRVGKIPVVLAGCFLAAPAIFLLTLAPYPWGTVLLLLFFGVCLMIRMPVAEAFLVSNTSEAKRSTVLGIYFFTAIEAGGIFTPVLGYMIDHLGFSASFSISSAVLLGVTSVSAIFLLKTK